MAVSYPSNAGDTLSSYGLMGIGTNNITSFRNIKETGLSSSKSYSGTYPTDALIGVPDVGVSAGTYAYSSDERAHQTDTLYDLNTMCNNISTLITTFQASSLGLTDSDLSTKEKSYLSQEKQNKLIKMTRRARQFAFELNRFNQEMALWGTASDPTTYVPDSTQSIYPSSKNRFTVGS